MRKGGDRVDWVQWSKQWILARPRLRALARRLFVAPRQVRALRALASCHDSHPAARERPDSRPVVLLLALRPWGLHRGWEGLLARRLEAGGARVVWATCDGLLTRCDAMLPAFPEAGLCSHCTRFNRDCASAIGVERVALSDSEGLSPTQRRALRERADETPVDPRIASHITASFQRLRAGGMRPLAELDPEDLALWRELAFNAELVDRVAPALLDKVRPDALLALNGKFFAESIILEHAVERDLPVWTYERGNVRDTIVLTPRSVAVPFDTEAISSELRTRELTPEQRQRAEHYLGVRSQLGNGQVRFIAAGAKPIDASWRSEQCRVVALFTNLIWDSGVVGEDTIFASMFDWIGTTIDQLGAQPNTRLVLRVHPAEERVYWHPTRDRVRDYLSQRYANGLPANVNLVDALDPVDSYSLMEAADLVLTYTSSVGIEAAALGKTVVTAARSNYSGAPFVHTPATAAEYQTLLAQTTALAPPPEAAELALRFTYRLYFELMLPVPFVRETATGFAFDAERTPSSDSPLDAVLRQLVTSARDHAERRAVQAVTP